MSKTNILLEYIYITFTDNKVIFIVCNIIIIYNFGAHHEIIVILFHSLYTEIKENFQKVC